MNQKPLDDFELSYRYQHSITILEFRIQLQNQEYSGIEDKTQQYVNISGIVMAIVSGLLIDLLNDVNWWTALLFSILVALPFVSVIVHSLRAMHPRQWMEPIDAKDIDDLLERVKKGRDEPYFDFIFATHNRVIHHNDKVLSDKRRVVKWIRRSVHVQLFGTLILMLIAIWG